MASGQRSDNVAQEIAAKENRFLQGLSWVSVSTVVLYGCSVAWRLAYYTRLGIPFAILEFPFPGILIPRPPLIAFVSNTILAFIGTRFYLFYEQQKRSQRAQMMGVTDSLKALTEYAVQTSAEAVHEGKKNIQVLYARLVEHIDRKKDEDEEWTFNVEEFEREIKPLFPDLPAAISNSFVRYGCQLFVMESDEIRETMRDSLGAPPRGSKHMDALGRWFPWALVLLMIANLLFEPAYALRMLIFILLGAFLGQFLAKLMEYEDRYQFWWAVWMSLIVLVVVSAIDGHETARGQLNHGSLPVAIIEQCDGAIYTGALLADFPDGYVIFTDDPNDPSQCVKLHKQEVKSVKLKTASWLRRLARRREQESLRELDELVEEVPALVEDARELLDETETADVNVSGALTH